MAATQYDVLLVDGPFDGQHYTMHEPWPREGYLQVQIGGVDRKYDLRPGGPPWIADFREFGPEDEDVTQTTEGEPGAAGPTGPVGPEGPAGGPGPAGKSVEWRGEWLAGTTYSVNDTVSYEGGSYISLADLNSGQQPDVRPGQWARLAAKGDVGDVGPEGPIGPEGPEGPQGPAGSPLPERDLVQVVSGALDPGDGENGTIPLTTGYRILYISADKPCWVRLYTTIAKRAADSIRTIDSDPVGDHGVVVEVVLSPTLLGLSLSPVPQGYSFEVPPSPDIPYRIVNADNVSGSVTVDFVWQAQENVA